MTIPMTEVMKSGRLPTLSHIAAASRAQNKFQMARIPLISSWLSINGAFAKTRLNTNLDGRISDTDEVQDLIEVEGSETVARPLFQRMSNT